jgi:hypothetical protein
MKREELARMAREDPERYLNILAQVVRAPKRILEELTNYRFPEPLPGYRKSDNDPPMVIRESTETIPIDEYLGLYEPKKRKITIFEKGIDKASRLIDCRRNDLRYIVELHEFSHAIVHLGIAKDEVTASRLPGSLKEYLSRATRIYMLIDKKLHEHLAQLLAYHGLGFLADQANDKEARDAIDRLIATFHKLSARQPAEYRVDGRIGVPRGRVLESLRILKKGWLKGSFEAWSTVVCW